MVTFIDAHRDTYGVEPICAVLPIAPSTYWWHRTRHADPVQRSKRAHRDDRLRAEIQRIWNDNEQVYGAEKVWRQLRRDGHVVARCTVERLMRQMSLRGAVRGRASSRRARLTARHDHRISSIDSLSRTRPNQLWVSDFTYVATWRGFVYVAFVIDVFARCGDGTTDLVHHSDRGSQYLTMRYTERLADAGINPSVGSRGDSYDNALAESVIGLFKTEVIQRKGPWRHAEAVEFATLRWVDWFNNRRLLEPIGHVPPAEYEALYYESTKVA